MFENILSVLTYFGGITGLLGVLAFIVKIFLDFFMKRNLEAYKSDLNLELEKSKSELTVKLEEQKALLQVEKDTLLKGISTTLEFSKDKANSLHQQRLLIIPKLYGEIHKVILGIRKFLYSNFLTETNFDELKDLVFDINSVYEYYLIHKIYFDSNFCDLLENFNEKLEAPIRTIFAIVDEESNNHLSQQELTSKINFARNSFAIDSESILQTVEEKFREILGSD